MASPMGAILCAASQATVVLLLLHTATDILLLARTIDHESASGFCARVAMFHGALLVGLRQPLVTAGARILLQDGCIAVGRNRGHGDNEQLHCDGHACYPRSGRRSNNY